MSPRPTSASSIRSRPILALIVVLALGAFGSTHADGQDLEVLSERLDAVIYVKVPESEVGRYSGPGVPVRRLPFDELNALVARAEKARDEAGKGDLARPVAARHEVRWDGSDLVGRSTFQVQDAGSREAGWLALDPWSPRTSPARADLPGRPGLHALDDGRQVLWTPGAGVRGFEVEWRQPSRTGTAGRAFDLELPAVSVENLTLELPEGLEPRAVTGIVRGPEDGAGPASKRWEIVGAGGRHSLRIVERGEQTAPGATWVSGPTRVEISGASAEVIADWRVEGRDPGARTVAIALDPGLELAEVTGPHVSGSSTLEEGGRTVAEVRLSESAPAATTIRLRAIAAVPPSPRWEVPTPRPLSATWAGGRIMIRAGPGRPVADSSVRGGTRVRASRDTASGASSVICYESTGPETAVSLEFGSTAPVVTAAVTGELDLRGDRPRLKATIRWRALRGPVAELAVDLPEGWTPESVSPLSEAGPTSWWVGPRPEGGLRVTMTPPATFGTRLPWTVVVDAIREGSVLGEIDTPRVRPVAATLVDDTWLAYLGANREARPSSSTEIAWLDRRGGPPELADAPVPIVASPDLAWRRPSENSRLVLAVRERRGASWGRAWTVVREGAGGRSADWFVRLDEGQAGRTAAIGATAPTTGPISWRLLARGGAVPLPANSLPEAARAALGLPIDGDGWAVELPGAGEAGAPMLLHAHLDPGQVPPGPVPLIVLPAERFDLGIVLIRASGDSRIVAEVGPGLSELNPSEALADLRSALEGLVPAAELERAGDGTGAGFLHGPGGGRLDFKAEPLRTVGTGGWIAEARLETMMVPSGQVRHRLVLDVEPGAAESLTVTLPPGAEPLRCRRDGEPIRPFRFEGGLVIPMTAAASRIGRSEVVLDYLSARVENFEEAGVWPRYSLPCLSSSWEVVPADGLEAEPRGGVPLRAGGGGEEWRSWNASPSSVPSMLVEQAEAAGPIEPTLGDWLARIDAGPIPVLADRLAMAGAGFGPDSRLAASGAGSPEDRLATAGLAIVAVGEAGLLTTVEVAFAIRDGQEDRQGLAFLLAGAALEGSDPSDRYLSAAEWRGSATPSIRGGSAGSPSPSRAARRWVELGVFSGGWNVSWRDLGSGRALRWAVAVALLGLGLGWRTSPRRVLAAAWGLAVAVGLVASTVEFEGWSAAGGGFLLGAVASGCVWVGGARGSRRRGTWLSGSSSRRRLRLGRSRVVCVLPLLAGLAGPNFLEAQIPTAAPAPILVLLPYGKEEGAGAEPKVAVLLLSDYRRLEALAEEAPTPNRTAAATARHEVSAEEDAAVVVSEFALDNPSDKPGLWSLPFGPSRELTAVLDGGSIVPSLADGEDGKRAQFSIPPGRHRLRVRREVPDAPGPEGLPINPVASATRLSEGPGGAIVTQPIGPVESLELGRPGAVEGLGSVAMTAVWDVAPAGDRLVIRVPAGGGTSPPLRLVPREGLAFRGSSAPSRVFEVGADATRSGRGEVLVDLSGEDREDLELEFWRPAHVPSARAATLRPAPIVRASGGRGFSGPLVVRSLLGRNVALFPVGPGFAEVDEAPTDRAGPDQPRVVGIQDWSWAAAGFAEVAAPDWGAAVVEPTVELDVTPGRLGIKVEALARSKGGIGDFHGLEVGLPGGAEFQLTGVDAKDLTSWDRPGAGRLRLRFDGAEAVERTIRIEGWLPLPSPPYDMEGRGAESVEVVEPWPTWPGSLVEEGRLRISVGDGLRARWLDARGLAEVGGIDPSLKLAVAGRASYRIGPGAVGRLQIESGGPRLGVSTRSRLALGSERADWRAVARYRIGAGSASTFRVADPEGWGEGLEVSVPGHLVQVRREREGSRGVIRLDLDPPVWGSAELVFRASKPLGAGGIKAPDLVPLGSGQVERYEVGWEDYSGLRMRAETTEGLQPIETSESEAILTTVESSISPGRYRVIRDGWVLALGSSQGPTAAGAGALTGIDLVVALDERGEGFGRASCRFVPGASGTVALPLPEGVEPIAVRLGVGRSRAPLLDESGALVLTVPGGGDPRLEFLFATRALPEGLPLPAVSGLPFNLTAYVPEGARLLPSSSSIWEITAEARSLARLEELGREAAWRAEAVGDGGPVERAELLEVLSRFELRARGLRRLMTGARPATRTGRPRPDPLGSRIDAIEAEVSESLRAAGVEPIGRMARARVSIWDEESSRSASEFASAAAPAWPRFPKIGQTWSFEGVAPGGGPFLSWTPPPASREGGTWLAPGLAAMAVVLAGVVGFAPRRWRRFGAFGLASLAVSIPAFVGVTGTVLAAGVGLALGWLTSRFGRA